MDSQSAFTVLYKLLQEKNKQNNQIRLGTALHSIVNIFHTLVASGYNNFILAPSVRHSK